MSDLYDSLEDECDHYKSSDSLESLDPKFSPPTYRVSESKSSESRRSFYLNEEEKVPDGMFCEHVVSPQHKNFSPNIDFKGAQRSYFNVVVDNEILSKQGLQLNSDGSFTKSPRSEAEELPFVTREYKNLQFQKKKMYEAKKKHLPIKVNRKNLFSFSENPENGISMIDIISARGKKGSSEEILTSGDSLPSVQVSERKQFPKNLTDSMKENILKNQKKSTFEKVKASEDLKKVHCVLNLLDANKKFSSIKQQTKPEKVTSRYHGVAVQKRSVAHCNLLSDLNAKGYKPDILKYQSDVILKPVKPLSYSERRQKENGFDPLSLRYGKKVPSDTNRSTFGDSVSEKLSEISCRVLNYDTAVDTDEESFYKKVIEKDKTLALGIATSNNSSLDINSSVKSDVSKDKLKTKPKKNLKNKRALKSTSIDLLDQPPDPGNSSKKFGHYCTTNSPPISKNELALKAKAYGYMANARNIFKLKSLSKSKISETVPVKCLEGKSVLKKVYSEQGNSPKPMEKISRIKSSEQANSTKTNVSFSKIENVEPKKTQAGFYLPQINSLMQSENKFRPDILKRISSCLNNLTRQIDSISTN